MMLANDRSLDPSADPIPDDVRDFILACLNSVAELEGLLLMHRNPESEWTAQTLALQLYITVPEADIVLKALSTCELLSVKEGRYAYAPRTAALDRSTSRLSQIYRRSLLPVTGLIHSKARTAAQHFADAFRLKGSP